jgi:hypothetical protein
MHLSLAAAGLWVGKSCSRRARTASLQENGTAITIMWRAESLLLLSVSECAANDLTTLAEFDDPRPACCCLDASRRPAGRLNATYFGPCSLLLSNRPGSPLAPILHMRFAPLHCTRLEFLLIINLLLH